MTRPDDPAGAVRPVELTASETAARPVEPADPESAARPVDAADAADLDAEDAFGHPAVPDPARDDAEWSDGDDDDLDV